jgi:threonine/homoserine/homoserine lactone efflux protein
VGDLNPCSSLITLGDQKAIVFYLGFFPAFIDLAKISTVNAMAIVLMAIASVGGVKLGYAIVADRARLLISPKITKSLNIAAGCVTIAVGIFSIVKP